MLAKPSVIESVYVSVYIHTDTLCFCSRISDVYLTISIPKGSFPLVDSFISTPLTESHRFTHSFFFRRRTASQLLNDEICWATNIKTDVRILCLSKIVWRISSVYEASACFFCREKRGKSAKIRRLEVIFRKRIYVFTSTLAQITITQMKFEPIFNIIKNKIKANSKHSLLKVWKESQWNVLGILQISLCIVRHSHGNANFSRSKDTYLMEMWWFLVPK